MSDWRIGTTAQSQAEATPFATAGLANLTRNLVASGLSTVTFEVQTQLALTADLDFAYASSYIIWKDTVRWFYGRVTSIPRQGDDQTESVLVTLADPHWYLLNAAYMQSWRIYDVDGEALINVNKTRVILFQDSAGARLSTGNQVADVIDWLIARSAPIAKGTIDAGIELPFDERTNVSCADVLDTVLRWTPDYVGWFDYSTTPKPTFHFRAKTNLTPITKAFATVSKLSVTPRYDLQKPGIVISYEKTHTVDSDTYNTVETDTAGDPDAIDTVQGVFDLQGSTRTFVKQKIVSEEYPTSNSKTWWKAHVTWLNAIADADISIHDHAVDADIDDYHRILTDGTIQDWMTGVAIQSSIRAQADVTIRDGSDNIIEVKKNVEICATVIATDLVSNTYWKMTSFDSGEETPTGVAAALYDAWSTLHYEGSLTTIEAECAGTLAPGTVINISGGRTEWATMAALVQSCAENVDTGSSTIQFGPATLIEADSLVALFRAFRSRRYSWQAAARATGSATGAGEVSLSGSSKDTSQSSGGGETTKLKVTNTDGTYTHVIALDPTIVSHADGGNAAARTLQPRECYIGELSSGNPVLKLRQVLCSASYGTPLTLGVGNAANPGASIVTLGGNTEGSEAASSDTWTTGATNGLAVWKVCRVGYFDAGDKKLYSYVRLFTYDKNGQLYSVSAETRVEVDAPVAET